ncbi:MAG: hypothetical protein JWQ09_2579 [Segetibacter sp.]|nr:hypothetical protein [Segetibacter sp.]
MSAAAEPGGRFSILPPLAILVRAGNVRRVTAQTVSKVIRGQTIV